MTFWRVNVPMRRRMFILAMAAALLVAGSIVAFFVTSRYRLGLSLERVQSLPSSHFIVDLHNKQLSRDAYIAFYIPHALSAFFPSGTTFVKRIVGLPGDLVHVGVAETTVNGVRVAGPLDGAKDLHIDPRSLVRTLVVPPGELFVVGTEPRSWDSRYWGTVPFRNVEGRAWLL